MNALPTFQKLNVSEEILQAIEHMGFEETTPIQRDTIPLALEGKDLIGQAQTGTGKTAAFGIPMIEKIQTNLSHLQGIVIAPTRELAIQVSEELNRIGQMKGIRCVPIYGGQEIGRQIRSLQKRPHIVAATPGRLMDHMRRKTIKLDQISTVVLDEADEMLNMGFIDDIKEILKGVPEQRQTLLFSATMPKAIQDLAGQFMKDAQVIRVKSKEVTVPNIEQHYVEVPEKKKFDILCNLLDIQSPDLAIIFGRTKRRVDELSEALNKRAYAAEGIHGDLTQTRRDQVMRKFKSGNVDILVATDVAARGLDITGVTHIYNFDVPQDPESYVHRIGRTGRAGHKGMAYTFATPREIAHLKTIERVIKRKMERQNLPTMDEAREGQKRLAMDKLLKIVKEEDISSYRNEAENLLEESDVDSITLLAGALKSMTKEPDTTPVRLTAENPMAGKRGYGGKSSGGNRSRSGSGGYGKSNFKSDRSDRSGSSRRYSNQRSSGGGRRPSR